MVGKSTPHVGTGSSVTTWIQTRLYHFRTLGKLLELSGPLVCEMGPITDDLMELWDE